MRTRSSPFWSRLFPGPALPTTPDELLDYESLKAIAAADRDDYAKAAPFPHAVIDDLLPPATLARVLDEIPRPDDRSFWLCFDARTPEGQVAQQGKLHLSDERLLGPTLRRLFQELRGAAFLQWLESLTGIGPLIPDPHNFGGGLHVCLPGAVLRIHADFGRHPLWKLDRRLNLLLYLNEDWPDSYGGHLELWSEDMSASRRRIAPIANRCVIFSTSRTSFHGHPDPLACPRGRTRNAIALYYYTNGRPPGEAPPDLETLWQTRPQE